MFTIIPIYTMCGWKSTLYSNYFPILYRPPHILQRSECPLNTLPTGVIPTLLVPIPTTPQGIMTCSTTRQVDFMALRWFLHHALTIHLEVVCPT